MISVFIERHPQLYFPDGDIALLAVKEPLSHDGPPSFYVFRIHKFLLRHHSETFANMLADANSHTDNVYDGVPLVEMHGDKAEDLAQLLNFIYNPSSMTLKRHDPDAPIVVSGIIRLADKYCLQSLHDHLVKQVVSDWPTTLHEWDILQGEISAILKTPSTAAHHLYGDHPEDKALADLIPEPVSAILFAQEFGCSEILPAAFYQLSRIKVQHDWTLRSDPDGKRVALARWSLLDKDNLVRYLRGYKELADYFPAIRTFLSAGCTPFDDDLANMDLDDNSCYVFLHRVFTIMWTAGRGSRRDPLHLLLLCLEVRNHTSDIARSMGVRGDVGLCQECWDKLEEEIPQERKRLWDSLLQYFTSDINNSL
ncbi:hypothetical protein BD309DRAFT_951203 [Dichomitus squalens]|nr:hypothetical protein BD309DRAFT_951203 [Dichomitus squalens]